MTEPPVWGPGEPIPPEPFTPEELAGLPTGRPTPRCWEYPMGAPAPVTADEMAAWWAKREPSDDDED